MIRQPRIGLLPLFLKLYDDVLPKLKPGFASFIRDIADGFAARDIDVAEAPVCRLAGEFDRAVADCEARDVDCIVTLHLAYSPSLESVPALTRSTRPILILDTTMDADFGMSVHPDRILYNHGVHGVMDLASMLRRNGRAFEIVAGHPATSPVLDRAADVVRGAYAARCLGSARTLRVGAPFQGMGDFAVEPPILKQSLGITVDGITADELAAAMPSVTDAEIADELAADRRAYTVTAAEAVHRRSVHVGLALRRQIEAGRYTACSVNFQAFNRADGPVMPFLEISKSMQRGIGYAGEGDVLTAAFVGALAQAFGATTFTEIFCADWRGGNLFLSHMGEINPAVAASRPVIIEKDLPFMAAQNPAALVCAVRPGPAVYANLVPGPRGAFEIVAAPMESLGDTGNKDLHQTVRGWMRPARPVAEFLEAYSRLGGTHHAALVLGARLDGIRALARFAGLPCHVL